ncbi:MAG TPA: hypothetical protein VGX03_02385 [Candidatus Binatia bacterium]|jgi:hypothetical protein|nr:hypothetical protein [Candidatus Binatia bacterium]
MSEIGYALSSEEHGPNDLIRYAQRAEQVGFSFALISDHYHPFSTAGGGMKSAYGQLTVCWAPTEELARKIAREWWPTAGFPPELNTELALPQHFAQVASLLSTEAVAKTIVCGPNPELYIASIRKYFDAGYDYVYLHQIGPDQEGFFRFCEKEVLPKFH